MGLHPSPGLNDATAAAAVYTYLARLPISDAMESLNVSNAAAVALYAVATRG